MYMNELHLFSIWPTLEYTPGLESESGLTPSGGQASFSCSCCRLRCCLSSLRAATACFVRSRFDRSDRSVQRLLALPSNLKYVSHASVATKMEKSTIAETANPQFLWPTTNYMTCMSQSIAAIHPLPVDGGELAEDQRARHMKPGNGNEEWQP